MGRAVFSAPKPIQRGGRSSGAGRVLVTSRNLGHTTNQVAAVGHTHHRTYNVRVSSTDLVCRFVHYLNSGVKEAVAAAAFTFRASVRVNGQNHELTKNGAKDLVINPGGGWLDTDPVSVGVDAGTDIIVSTYLISAATLPYGTSWSAGGNTYGDTYTLSTDATTPTAAVGTGSSAWLYGPSAVYGTPKNGATVKPAIAGVGDSIVYGVNDSGSYGGIGGGYFARALDAAGFPWVNVGRTTSSANNWTDLYGRKIRAGLLADCSYAVVNLGVNDLNAQGRTAVQTETDLISVCKTLLYDRGIGAYVCTVTPITSSTDSWATTGNQTVTVGTPRTDYNDWIRAGCPVDASTLAPVAIGTAGALLAGQAGHPIRGYFEAADTVETARNSGKWKSPSYTSDGLHPDPTGAAAIAAAIDTTRFV